MGDEVLVLSMGLKNIFRAAKRLDLPNNYTAKQIAAYLGKQFEATYKIVTNDYKEWIKYRCQEFGLLVGATGWTRYCFGNPSKNKRALNAYLAHAPQSLNAMILNKAVLNVFYNVWMKYPNDFKFCAQIHDSILFMYREGREDIAELVKENMLMDIEVTDISGIKRSMRVPVDLSLGGKSWQDSKDH